ncbi:hypothetical protein GA0070611_4501 [Micromonospora auratinigra]|uniref:Uncharacterized protein n=2 Tax=Micromonospora auratinigra TaxID=261654 RepID=A0A1A9A0J6_9ACTN|nr:hypothetical protein GA0070611_4501 [Micromonospora auratinigra]
MAPWGESAEPLPVDSERHRTPSRRRALERGQDEPVDAYLPGWAVESGVRRADGGGRHAAPDDDEVEPPYPDGGRRGGTEADWRTDGGGRGLRAIGAGPVSEHTAEWTLDAPQEQGYVGSRRADSEEPVSGPGPRSRPRRAQTRRPQVTWSGLEETAAPGGDGERWEAGSTGRRARRAAPEPRSTTAADPWSRSAGVDPATQPAVDPWDASGVHAWDVSGPAARWERSTAAGRGDGAEHTGEWDRVPDGGEWERYADAGRGDTGRWAGYPEADQWDRTAPSVPAREGWASAEQAEAFWSGTRLAGDDPRWVDTPTSAPRSPVVPYSASRAGGTPRPWRAAPVATGRGATPRRRVEPVGGGSWSRRLEDDLLDPDPGGPVRSLVYTAACYLVPAVLFFVGLLFLDGRAPAGCVTDITGGGCDSPRAHAFGSLVAGAPRFALALVSSLVIAVVLRRVGTTWRSATVALAAAVVGGGLSTVMISAVTGQPIG